MSNSFEKVIQRRGTNCVKWDTVPEDVLPMWVADMDFEVAPCIHNAIMERAAHGVYGYTAVPASYYESVCNWFDKRHGWRPDPSWIVYTTGVVPAISACLKAFTSPGDKVILMSPVYNCFYSSVRNYGCKLADVPLLVFDGPHGPRYEIDYEALDEAAASGAKVMLICSPHNPACRVWTADELWEVGRICQKHGVIPVVDEIHCEFVMPGQQYTPFASVDPFFEDRCVILTSASKAFNIAGLQLANFIVKNPEYRAKIVKAINVNEICDVNPFGVVAAQAAYTDEGYAWLCGLNEQIYKNYCRLGEALSRFPSLHLFDSEGTYLAWIDVKALGIPSADLVKSLEDNEKVLLNAGSMYGQEGYVRVNMACPPETFDAGVRRIVAGLERLGAK